MKIFMNAKTIFIYMFVSSIILAIAVASFYFFHSKYSIPNNCHGVINFTNNEAEEELIYGRVSVIYHLVNDNKYIVNEYGTVHNNNKSYTMDRVLTLTIQGKTKDDVIIFKKGKVELNATDNVPPDISAYLAGNHDLLFYKFTLLKDNLWSISDVKRVVFVCQSE